MGSWLKAAFYYSDNFQGVKEIINYFKGTGLLVGKKNKSAVNNDHVLNELVELRENYHPLIDIMDNIEAKKVHCRGDLYVNQLFFIQ